MATLLEIRDKVRQRSDVQAETKRYPDAELNKYINDSYKELYGLLVQHSLMRDEASDSISADGSATYTVPADHYATLGVFKEENDYYRRLGRHTFRGRPHGAAQAITGEATSYRIAKVAGAKTIELYPRSGSGTYIHAYIPVPTDLAADGDTLDSVLGWDEYVVIDAAIKVLRKEESDTRDLKADKFEIMARIEMEAEAQEMAQSLTVANTRPRISSITEGALFDSADYRWYMNGNDY